jgi:hydroxyacyl-ACP dehydratase HTD2-like protein with hotdog domain
MSRCSAAPMNWRPAYAMFGVVRERHGPTHNDFACPYGHFPTKEGQVGGPRLRHRQAVRSGWPRRWAGRNWLRPACMASRRPDWRTVHDVNEIVRDWCGSLTREEVLKRCYATGAPAGPLNNIADIFGDRQFHARRNLVSIDVEDLGETVIVPSVIPRLSETPGQILGAISVPSSESIPRRCLIAEKAGKTGSMVFVTVKHQVKSARGVAVTEEQDIVYLAKPTAFNPPPPTALPAAVAWREAYPVDPVLLFRFSALTFNAHKIHYDRRYAADEEKYPGLVVHGPLQALLLLESAKRHHPGQKPASYTFRGMRPMFDFDRISLCGQPKADQSCDLYTANGDDAIGMQATVSWRE